MVPKLEGLNMPGKRKYKSVKDAEQRRYMAEDASRTLKRLAEIKRDIKEIKADKELLQAAKNILKEEIADTKKVLTT